MVSINRENRHTTILTHPYLLDTQFYYGSIKNFLDEIEGLKSIKSILFPGIFPADGVPVVFYDVAYEIADGKGELYHISDRTGCVIAKLSDGFKPDDKQLFHSGRLAEVSLLYEPQKNSLLIQDTIRWQAIK